MAFNFNWSPLAADADFYTRAQEMLTTALNKSPKPPIIVDDILVNELNLGSVPPDLEILEIGDLAEDRFRGIFKMCYSGDAFLTLKTRVQANPMSTYLFSKPTFTSPQPLAAASGLTIPLQITLSNFKLSAFIILVFSKQKGLTLVFRNDPLESLKVSSTFDSIPFVRDYLQKTIEMQLRTLMMDELPAIIHRLSLQLWCPELGPQEGQAQAEAKRSDEVPLDPFSSPPQDAVDARGNVLDGNEIANLSLDGGSEMHSLFSQKNLLRLAALTDSQRTLSLFTPSIRDTVFRAWAGPSERNETTGTSTPVLPLLSRANSTLASAISNLSNRGSDDGTGHIPSRPSLVSIQSATTGLSLGAGRHSRSQMRRKKNRVVNLRRSKTTDGSHSDAGDSETASVTASESITASESAISETTIEEPEDNIIEPPRTPSQRVRFRNSSIDLGDSPRKLRLATTPRPIATTSSKTVPDEAETQPTQRILEPAATIVSHSDRPSFIRTEKSLYPVDLSAGNAISATASVSAESGSSEVLEQAWVLKIARELAHRSRNEKISHEGLWAALAQDRDAIPPPAYEARALT